MWFVRSKVHFQVLAHLHTTNPAYSVYFSRCPQNNEYSAIVTVREDWRFNTKQQKQVGPFRINKVNIHSIKKNHLKYKNKII